MGLSRDKALLIKEGCGVWTEDKSPAPLLNFSAIIYKFNLDNGRYRRQL